MTSRPSKVLAAIVIPPHLKSSGAVTAGNNLSRALSAYCQMDVAVMSTEESIEVTDGLRWLKCRSVPPVAALTTRLPNKIRTPLYRSTIPQKILNNDYDLVHIHNPMPTLEMARIAQAALQRGIPYCVSTHGFVEVTSQGDAYGLSWLEKLAWNQLVTRPLKFVLDNAAMMFPTSPHDCEILQRQGVSAERMIMVTNGVDRKYLQPVDQQVRSDLVARWNLSNNTTPICFFLANHTANKGIQVLLDALNQIKVPFTAIIGGKKRDGLGYPQDSFEPNELGQRIILTDWLSDDETRATHDLADVFVLPTLSDTLPLVNLEAMATGTPVVSTTVGGIPFQVPENCGRLVPPGDAAALAAALTDMFQLPSENRMQMGHQCHVRVQTHFDWDLSAKTAFSAYQQLLQTDEPLTTTTVSGTSLTAIQD